MRPKPRPHRKRPRAVRHEVVVEKRRSRGYLTTKPRPEKRTCERQRGRRHHTACLIRAQYTERSPNVLQRAVARSRASKTEYEAALNAIRRERLDDVRQQTGKSARRAFGTGDDVLRANWRTVVHVRVGLTPSTSQPHARFDRLEHGRPADGVGPEQTQHRDFRRRFERRAEQSGVRAFVRAQAVACRRRAPMQRAVRADANTAREKVGR